MHLIRLIHWNAAEAAEKGARLASAGHRVIHQPPRSAADAVPRSGERPDVVVIDLSRSPARGRYIAMELRARQASCDIPIIFLDGAPEKVAQALEFVPAALSTTTDRLPATIASVIAAPPVPAGAAPRALGWAHRPLAEKLGITAGVRVSLIDPPDGFVDLLGDLPEGVMIRNGASRSADIVIWFVESAAELAGRIAGLAELAADLRFWIAWPKQGTRKSSRRGLRHMTDLSMNVVREAAGAMDLTEYKICSIDEVWSAMALAPRGGLRPRRPASRR